MSKFSIEEYLQKIHGHLGQMQESIEKVLVEKSWEEEPETGTWTPTVMRPRTLTTEEVYSMRHEFKEGILSREEIEKKYGVGTNTVYRTLHAISHTQSDSFPPNYSNWVKNVLRKNKFPRSDLKKGS